MNKVLAEQERLKRVDFRLNTELVQKPYAYINEVKKELLKEQNMM